MLEITFLFYNDGVAISTDLWIIIIIFYQKLIYF